MQEVWRQIYDWYKHELPPMEFHFLPQWRIFPFAFYSGQRLSATSTSIKRSTLDGTVSHQSNLIPGLMNMPIPAEACGTWPWLKSPFFQPLLIELIHLQAKPHWNQWDYCCKCECVELGPPFKGGRGWTLNTCCYNCLYLGTLNIAVCRWSFMIKELHIC